MRIPAVILIATSLFALSACKKDGADGKAEATASAPPTGLLGTAAVKATAKAAIAALPQPDANKSLSDYPELDSGNQVMFLYIAASKLPPDYEKLAASYSSEYRSTSDSFRKNDLLQAIKPQLDQKLALAAANPYGWMDIDDAKLGAYDFARKGFPVGEFDDGRYRYFYDNSDYKIGWINPGQVAFAPVPDEALARKIESMRSGYSNQPKLKVYFFAQSADLDGQKVGVLVTRVQITDKSGRVLVEYGPDGTVPVETEAEAEQECMDPAACAAAAAG